MSSSFPMRTMRVRFAGDSHVGMKRKHNEDRFLLPDEERLALVADGMGGHASGEVAAQFAIETIGKYFHETHENTERTWPFYQEKGELYQKNRLVVAVKLANQRIYEASQTKEALSGMGTTIVATLFSEDRVVIAHVGDSRVYRLRQNQLIQLTEDHSLLNDYLKSSRIRPEDAANFQQKNVIVRALGIKDSVQVDVQVDVPRLDDIYLLCSDGLTAMVGDEVIVEILQRHPDIDRACDALIQAANQNGGVDNITIIIAKLEVL